MKIVKWILNALTWLVAILLQFVFGYGLGNILFAMGYGSIIGLWVGMTIGIFIVGTINIIFRKAIKPKMLIARFGVTGLSTVLFLFIYHQFDFLYSSDFGLDISIYPLLANVVGMVGFYLLNWPNKESAFGKKTRLVGYGFSVLLLVAGIYAIWDISNPAHLSLQNIALGQTFNVELVQQMGGSVSTGQERPLVVRDNLVYIGMGPRLSVLDISDPNKIILIGQSDIIPDEIGQMVLVGDYLYIAPGIYGDKDGNNQKLHIVNISNPKRPQYLGMYSPYEEYVSSVFTFNNLLFITGKKVGSDFIAPANELFILDITNPSLPREVGHYSFRENITDIVVYETYAYVTLNTQGHAETGLRIIDISNPQSPKEIYALYPTGAGFGLILNRQTLYYFGTPDGGISNLYVLDISNPQVPEEVAVVNGIEYPNSIFFSENLVYLETYVGTHILDLTVPHDPQKVGTLSFEGRLVSVWGKYAFVVDGDRLELYDVTDPVNPTKVGEYIDLIPDDDASIYMGDTKGVLGTLDGFYVVDFSNATFPAVTSRYTSEDCCIVQKLQGNFLYVSKFGTRSREAIDISDPANPTIVWQSDNWDEYDKPFILLVEGKYAYIINSEDGFFVYDISNPAKPFFVSHQPDLKGFAEGFDDYAVVGNYMYILDGREIHILDVSDKTKITEVGGYNFPSSGSGYRRITIIDDLAFLDNSLYNGYEPSTLMILDLANPTIPKKVTSYYWREYSAIRGFSKQAVFITDDRGLHVVDFSNPKKPKEIGYYGFEISSCGYDCMALGSDNTIYVYSYPSGLYILHFILPSE